VAAAVDPYANEGDSMFVERSSLRRTLIVTAIASLFGISACNNDDDNGSGGAAASKDTSFANLTVASTDAEKRAVRASDFASIGGETREIGYNTVLRSGDQRGDSAHANTFGLLVDDVGAPLLTADGSAPVADSNDFSSLLPRGDKLYAVSQFESQPGAMYLTELTQDSETGKLTAVKTTSIDLSGIHGIWDPCAGMVTPWSTHLGSEEYEADAAGDYANNKFYKLQLRYFGGGTMPGGDLSKGNPYFWGFPVEVAVSDTGVATASKHYSMGRFAHELSYVMPDRKTVYQSDDGTNVGFYRYVADKAADLSAGTLYAAKWSQTSAAGASELGAADISWVELGHATDADVAALVNSGITFADIFDKVAATAGACPSGYTSISANGVGQECLKLKDGQETAAAFLESRRYAAYLGATTEFRKEEGISFDPAGKKLYVAYSEVNSGMQDNSGKDAGGPNHVKLMYNQCGAIYAYSVNDSYTITKAEGLLAGRMTTKADPGKTNPSTISAYADDSPLAANECDVEAIANPDNVSFMAGQKTLLIGEDSGAEHQNDMIWAYNIESKTLTRIATTPYGAETTSLYYYPEVDKFGYLMAVVQHPYGESDTDKVSAGSAERRSYLGYIGPLPPFKE
jgi:secreted PhoX family phosphatase